MAVFMTEDKTNLILDCKCGCDDAIKFKVDLEDADADIIMFATLLTRKLYKKICGQGKKNMGSDKK